MTTLSAVNPTLLDLANATDASGKIVPLVEILNETNEILLDMTWQEGNLPTGHQYAIRTGLPAPTWRKLYGGVQPTKSTRAKVTDSTGMMEAYAEIDKALADLNGNTAEFMMQENAAHIEGMNQEMAETIFYGNESTEPEAFTGFSPRFNSTTATNGDNVILGGSNDTDNRSIWLVCWSPMTCFGIVPKGSTAGLQMRNLGEVTIEDVDGSGGRMQAYRTHYRWDAGLAVKDWRYVVRIANIEVSDLSPTAATGANLPNLMFEAIERLPSQAGRCVFYMDRTVRTTLRQQLSNAVASSTLEFADVGGRRTMMFQDIPIRRVDRLAADEALLS